MHPTSPTTRLRRRFANACGFTMVELLVCLLILGIMAAIALPAWLDQRAKGEDADAKMTLKTMTATLVTYSVNEGTYDATIAELKAIEPTLNEARDPTVAGNEDEFTVTERSATGTTFKIVRHPSGRITRDCDVPDYGLCRGNLDGNDNRW